ncbi:hypothetical protein [Dyella nitratireducens]|uniref:Lysine-specific metallo-endopeptidase domain-containing protein n=1 Tax=Dyella nitratireducens TaxID=1849580 RepID=A0ABQ1GWH7_9GAMM|nr:hypothetical protein [Dyella nitratireducens]GGA51664.1 hypothetical protein GCM10010981_46350 [Dyella nitratireducens]GLQ41673.1 hypothetical protein GCM10007902_15230 [Dyella nitratireducens]
MQTADANSADYSRFSDQHTTANAADHSQPDSTTPQIAHIERPAGFPPGAPESEDRARSDRPRDLTNYQTSRNNLLGLTPDKNGIYTRVRRDGSKSYFLEKDRNVYQVANFDPRTTSWGVLDPWSQREITRVGLRNGEWVQTEQPDSQYPPGFRGRIRRALDDAIDITQRAKNQVWGTWNRITQWAMNTLYGPEASTPRGRRRIGAQLDSTLNALQRSKSRDASNLQVGGPGGPDKPSAVAFNNGTIQFSQYTLRTWRDADLNELMVHEHTHTGAGTRDGWYLDRNLNRLNNWGGWQLPFSFNNALNTADTVARGTSFLANNR